MFRSLSLGKQGLLPARSASAFLWHRGIQLPAILAGATTASVLCTGLLVWAATGSSAVFTVSVFFPAIVLLGGSTYRSVSNGYALTAVRRWSLYVPGLQKNANCVPRG